MGRDQNVKCPVCGEEFELDPDLERGDTTYCPGCYVDLKILNVTPPQVEEARDEDVEDSDVEGEEFGDEKDY